jgi:hypothetical protein
MTQPDGLVPDAETVTFEVKGAAEVAGDLRHAMAETMARLLQAWAAGVRGQSLREMVATQLRAAQWPRMGPRLSALAVEAVELGLERATRELTGSEMRAVALLAAPELELPDIDRDTRRRVREVLDVASILKLDTKRDVDAVIGKLGAVGSRAEGAARWAANHGINAGTGAVAEELGYALLWVPERDACLHCLAYAGWSVEAGQAFPPSLTFGDRPLELDGELVHPPLHPGCRCQVKLYPGDPGPPSEDRSSLDPAARLAAEARRSVVYGWTAHASQAATLRAMTRLLDQGANLPASVEKRARTLARKGQTQTRPR